MRTDWLGALTDIVQAICAVANISLLIYFTRKEWEHTKEKQNLERKEKTQDLEHLWYEKFVIDKVVPYLKTFSPDLSQNIVRIIQESVDLLIDDAESSHSFFSFETKVHIEKHVVRILKYLHEYDFREK